MLLFFWLKSIFFKLLFYFEVLIFLQENFLWINDVYIPIVWNESITLVHQRWRRSLPTSFPWQLWAVYFVECFHVGIYSWSTNPTFSKMAMYWNNGYILAVESSKLFQRRVQMRANIDEFNHSFSCLVPCYFDSFVHSGSVSQFGSSFHSSMCSLVGSGCHGENEQSFIFLMMSEIWQDSNFHSVRRLTLRSVNAQSSRIPRTP